MAGRCVIISGGDYSECLVPNSEDFVIACDKGLEWARKMDAKVDLLIGDFDSYLGDRPKELSTITLPHEKDDTDTHFAVKEAIKRGFDEIILTCAWGGRFDHAFANIQTCRYASENGLKVSLLDERVQIYFLTGGKNESIKIQKNEAMAVSLFALSDACNGVKISGTQYELEDASLTGDFPIGTSNEWEKAEAEFEIKKGTMMIVLSKM